MHREKVQPTPHLEDLVDALQADLLSAVQFVNVAVDAVHKEQAEANHLQQHMFLLWQQVVAVLKQRAAEVHTLG